MFNIPGAGSTRSGRRRSRCRADSAGRYRRHDAARICRHAAHRDQRRDADVVNGLVITGGNSIVRGLAINRFPLSGIFVPSPGNVFEGNFIGTDPAGTAALPNGDDGIKVRGSGNTIGGTSPAAQSHLGQPERRHRPRTSGDQHSGAGQPHRHERRRNGGHSERSRAYSSAAGDQQHDWRNRSGAQHPFRQLGWRSHRGAGTTATR